MRKIKRFLSALLCGAILITGTLAGVSVRTDAAASSYAVQLRAAGFPDSYISALSALHTAYPQWQFQAVKTGLDWNTVVSKESVNGVNLVPKTGNDATKSTADGAYDWTTNVWTVYDGSSWVGADADYIAYYLDPRNFLNETDIFQFESLSFSKVQTRQGSERIARAAFEYARKNGKHNVTAITKANIVKLADGNFLKAVHHIGETEYPDIEVQERLVDAMTAKMADPEFTRGCEVFVLPNLYGDIVTDAAAEMQGGLGSASSSNIGNKYALFEAIHGTAPFLINHGRGQYANPCSLIRAAGQLMAHIGYGDRTAKLEKALDICCNTEKKLVVTTDKDGATSEEFTTYLLDTLKSL